MEFQFNDGGRAAAGYKGDTGDCVVRAVTIATGLPYQEIYYRVNALAQRERPGKRRRGKSFASIFISKFELGSSFPKFSATCSREGTRCVYGYWFKSAAQS